jgi:hypothetical protein
MVTYKAMALIQLNKGYLDTAKLAGTISDREYTGRRKKLDETYKWFRLWFDREQLQDKARTEDAKRRLSIGLLSSQAQKENNELAIRICEIIDGRRQPFEEVENE